MKKLTLLASLLALLGLAACTGGNGAKNDSGIDTIFSKAQTDSLISAIGQSQGWQNNTKFMRAQEENPALSKQDFLRGMRYILDADTTTAFGYGMYTALSLIGQFNQWEAMGLKIDRSLFYNHFSKTFLPDSINEGALTKSTEIGNQMFRQLREAQQRIERAKIEASPEAIANVKRGREYVDSVIKADPAVKATASGVAVKVERPGQGEQVKSTDRITMNYTARTLDGREFDRSSTNVHPVLVSTRPAGLQEGLKQLAAGGKATIYVPGPEAYGVDKNRRYNLGPNETVIFEVEVLEINPKNN